MKEGAGRWKERLGEHCPRWTSPREAILGLIGRKGIHLSAKEIHAGVRAAHPKVGLATVYRTLDLLERSGSLIRIRTKNGESRYEFRSGAAADHHHHLICTVCGKIVDYRDFEAEELDLVRKTEAILAGKHDFTIYEHRIEFYGICRDCRPQERTTAAAGRGAGAPPARRRRSTA